MVPSFFIADLAELRIVTYVVGGGGGGGFFSLLLNTFGEY
jgi:hypothetical protein